RCCVGNRNELIEDIPCYGIGVARMWFAPASASASDNQDAIPALEREVRRSGESPLGAAAYYYNAVEAPLASAVDTPWRGGGSAIAGVEDYMVAFDHVFAHETEAAAMAAGTYAVLDVIAVAADEKRE